MAKNWLFDRAWTRNFTKARQDFIDELLRSTGPIISLSRALDVGCGTGDFSRFLADRALQVTGVDGRLENANEARRRCPDIEFLAVDAEDLAAAQIGHFDLVLCFGLLYHLENPFRAIRQLHSVTDKLLLVEGMCIPDSKPTMSLFDESTAEDQGLNYVAFYPSEPCLIKMLYRAGFPFVYRPRELPEHDLFRGSAWRKPVRTILVASNVALNVPNLLLMKEQFFKPPDTSSVCSAAQWNPWSTRWSGVGRYSMSLVGVLRTLGARALKPFRKRASSS